MLEIENMGSDNDRGGYSKKEQELIKRYAGNKNSYFKKNNK